MEGCAGEGCDERVGGTGDGGDGGERFGECGAVWEENWGDKWSSISAEFQDGLGG